MIEAELLGGWAGWSLRGLEVVDGWGGVWLCSDAAVAGRLLREGGSGGGRQGQGWQRRGGARGAPVWGAGRCKFSGALRVKTAWCL